MYFSRPPCHCPSFPSILLYHMGKLNYKLALLVFLTRFECVLIFPPERSLAALAINVSDSVKAGQENAFLGRTATDVNHGIEEIGTTLAALEGLRNEFVVVSEMSTAVYARISAVAGGQISLKSFDHDGVS